MNVLSIGVGGARIKAGVAKVLVNGIPDYVTEESYIVARLDDGDLWFWGAWEKPEEATKAAKQFENGIVVRL